MTTPGPKLEHDTVRAVRRELSDWRPWLTRALVIAFAALAGLTIVAFTWLTDLAFATFQRIAAVGRWLPLLWMPAVTAAIVWLTRRYAPARPDRARSATRFNLSGDATMVVRSSTWRS